MLGIFVIKEVAEKNLERPSKIQEMRPIVINKSVFPVPLSAFGDYF